MVEQPYIAAHLIDALTVGTRIESGDAGQRQRFDRDRIEIIIMDLTIGAGEQRVRWLGGIADWRYGM
jgi:hypothetical protein